MKVAESTNKLSLKWQTSLKNCLITYFNYPSEKFMNQIYADWEKRLVQFCFEIIVNGVGFLISITWILMFYYIHKGIYLGWWQIPLMIISMGFFLRFIQKTYIFFREGWRGEIS